MNFSSFAEGPLLWIVFVIVIIGIVPRIIFFISAIITSSKDSNSRWKYTVVTLARSLVPFHAGVTTKPFYAALRYIFHVCLIVVPVWLSGHIALWVDSRFIWGWAALPDAWADWMTLLIIALAAYFLIRRIIVKDIRLNSSPSDYVLIVITALPFMTGYFLTHGSLDSLAFLEDNMRLMHVLSAEAMLLVAVTLFYRARLNKETCTGCASCGLNCPTGTLASSDSGNLRVFTYSPYQCICCGACVKTCPEGAAELRHDISLKRLFQLTPKQEIRSVELKACERCGELFAPVAQVKRIAQSVTDTYFRYCARCKGRVMLREL
ncbi:4Fe-4S dicluster domain-containing protein [Thermodesulfobacteriota bacterium]